MEESTLPELSNHLLKQTKRLNIHLQNIWQKCELAKCSQNSLCLEETGRAGRSYLCEVMGSYKGKMKQCVELLIITLPYCTVITALHFGTVSILITIGTGLGQIFAMGPGQRSSVVKTRLPKHTFRKETIYI